jgi:hypothetical protein
MRRNISTYRSDLAAAYRHVQYVINILRRVYYPPAFY